MEIMKVQRRTASGLEDVGEFPSDIVESGENANGKYVKFADGTMICSGKHTTAGNCKNPINPKDNGLYYQSAEAIYFPAAFYEAISCNIATGYSSDGVRIMQESYLYDSYILFYLIGSTTAVEACNLTYTAIGRWK